MRYLTTLFVSLLFLLGACAHQPFTGPPWAKLTNPAKAQYETEYACPQATAFVHQAVGWETFAPEEPAALEGAYTRVVYGSDANMMEELAMLFYFKDAKGLPIIFMVITIKDEIILDYYAFRVIKPMLAAYEEGKISDEEADQALQDAFTKATGAYFCYLVK